MQPPDASRWARLKRIFGDALDLPPSARGSYLATECGADEALRAEIETLLACDAEATGFCETPAAGLMAETFEAASPAPRRFEPSSTLDAYEITSFVGAGGMGEVYRARDTRLGRDVAIKTLSAGAGNPAACARLLREAQHASILNHPNICTIHEAGESGGVPYIVMEFVEGRPLHELLRERPLPPAQAIAYARQIASALDHAHGRGVVHRDIKSSNVVVTADGRPIVLDFGLARRLPEGERPVTQTTVGGYPAFAGTLGYMAPELLLGGRADTRTDVWALGVLLYEMLTGALPFSGRTPFETSSAILGEPPRPLPRTVPLALRLVIARCLDKDPTARYQRASDVAAALERAGRSRLWPVVGMLAASRRRFLAGAAVFILLAAVTVLAREPLRRILTGGGPPLRTLAVLPLENATGQPEDDYYVDGITDALIQQLGVLKDVRVVSRGSTLRYRGRGASPVSVARELHAGSVVQGKVLRESGRVVVEATLFDGASGRVLWSDRLQRGDRDVLALQADIVGEIARAVHATVGAEARERLTLVRAVDPQVYEAYLKGRYHWNQRTPDSLQLAVREFDRAVALDPSYAPAHAALADCYNQLGTVMVGSGSPREFRPRAAAAAIKALQIDANSAEAHAALGYVKHYDFEWEEAERRLRRAIELNPSYALARVWYANLLMSRGRFDESLREIHAARELDPFSLVVQTNVGWILTVARREREAVAELEQTLQLDPTYQQARMRLSSALLDAGRGDDAIRELLHVVDATGRSPWPLSALAVAYARAGQRARAESVLAELLDVSRRRYVSPTSLGHVYLALGDFETALDYLERALDERTNGAAYMGVEPAFDVLRGHPQFQALLARARLD